MLRQKFSVIKYFVWLDKVERENLELDFFCWIICLTCNAKLKNSAQEFALNTLGDARKHEQVMRLESVKSPFALFY